MRPGVERRAVVAIVAVNALRALGSLVCVVLGAFSPTVAGSIWIVLQGWWRGSSPRCREPWRDDAAGNAGALRYKSAS